jgi:subtilisin family serine protease
VETSDRAPDDGAGLAIGILDSAVATHDAMLAAHIEQRDFVPFAGPRPTAHGTAVASILLGDSAAFRGRLVGATLYAGGVFFEDEHGNSVATTESLVEALEWLVGMGVPVVNMSLAGPPNVVLEAAVERTAASGAVVVAAVGNQGPGGTPLYPAAYASVVGVTAVDEARLIYPYANRGAHVTFAAPGVAVPVARAAGGYARRSGTSMATPYAAADIALALAAAPAGPGEILERLKRSAIDLGPVGFDETFGFGLIAPGRVPAQSAARKLTE